MKRLLFIATLAACASACVDGNNPVQLLDVRQVDAECKRKDLQLIHGTLNYNVSTHYVAAFSIFSPLDTTSTGTSGSGTGFYASEVDYKYTAKGVSATFKDESTPILFVVAAGAQPGDSYLAMDLIGEEARTKLNSVVPAAPDIMTLLVTIKLKGKLASGKATETNEVTYPIDITRAGSCPSGQSPVLAGPCDTPGQDGMPYTCG